MPTYYIPTQPTPVAVSTTRLSRAFRWAVQGAAEGHAVQQWLLRDFQWLVPGSADQHTKPTRMGRSYRAAAVLVSTSSNNTVIEVPATSGVVWPPRRRKN